MMGSSTAEDVRLYGNVGRHWVSSRTLFLVDLNTVYIQFSPFGWSFRPAINTLWATQSLKLPSMTDLRRINNFSSLST